MALPTGVQAPDFSSFNSDKQPVTLGQFRGKNVVLLFFPQAFTGVCTQELCSVRDNLAQYEKLDAQVLGISVDSIFTLHKFREEQQFNFPLVSDFNKNISKSYDVLYEVFPAFEMQGVSKRAAFVVDKEGVIRYSEECATPGDQPDFAAIEACLSRLAAA